ncbi:indolepyruvate oxidoreductase subunit beta family protein [Aestuariivirga sp.]|uniref:indolepyruvate oxidoreductase subunit beta family protein n=1 Tax=Aestuariivirga sp. TaxID=2650926 RepID=UPI003BAC4322
MFDSVVREKPLTIAILAMGGQGGGTLADWIVAVAEANGWHAQSTSVPGVAQRTGATLYYIEMLPPRDGRAPVLALMPTPGDVDVVIASELMEAGRSILRGLATPEKTLIITSIHRAYAVAEKEKPGLSIADPKAVNAAAGIAARRIIAFDMEQAARENGTVISAPLLGALAGAAALPFPRESFEAVISAGGKGTAASLKGFAAGFSLASSNELPELGRAPAERPPLPESLGRPALDQRLLRLRALPVEAQAVALAGLKRCIDFQDLAYGDDYLTRIEVLARLDDQHGGAGRGHGFTVAAAKYLANALTYDDVIGVADLKTRSARFARIAQDMKAGDDPIYLTEFMHPRGEEIVSLLPARLGRRVLAKPRLMAFIDARVNRGRHVETSTLSGFLQLYLVSGLRRWRRTLLRHETEMRHVETWLQLATGTLPANYDLARAVLAARRLIKGYSDTHARGLSKFDRVISMVPELQGREDGGQWMDRMIAAALKDEDGTALDGVMKTIREM